MNHIKQLKQLARQSAGHISKYGHHQFDMWDLDTKACCIMGAARMLDQESGYSHILRDVLAFMGYDENWNDTEGRTKEEVVNALLDASNLITPDLLKKVYGRHWIRILDMIHRVDSWSPATYQYIEDSAVEPFIQESNDFYSRSLASFLSTVMTQEIPEHSLYYHGYFDIEWHNIHEHLPFNVR